jgi:hypothetical protein
MNGLVTARIAGLVAIAALLAACGGSGTSATVPASGAAAQQTLSGVNDAAGPNLSGEYAGPVKDNVYGKGKGSAFYAAYGNSVGGVLTLAFKKATLAVSVSQTASGSNLTGSSVGGSGTLYCTSSTTATYDKKTHVLSGSYKTVYGCTGETGTFTLKQACFFKGSGSNDIRPDAGVKAC